MKFGENNQLMRQSFLQSFIRIGQKCASFIIGQFSNVSRFSSSDFTPYVLDLSSEVLNINFGQGVADMWVLKVCPSGNRNRTVQFCLPTFWGDLNAPSDRTYLFGSKIWSSAVLHPFKIKRLIVPCLKDLNSYMSIF